MSNDEDDDNGGGGDRYLEFETSNRTFFVLSEFFPLFSDFSFDKEEAVERLTLFLLVEINQNKQRFYKFPNHINLHNQ